MFRITGFQARELDAGGWGEGEDALFEEAYGAHQRCSVYDLFCEPILFLARVSSVKPFRVNCSHLGNCLGSGNLQHLGKFYECLILR